MAMDVNFGHLLQSDCIPQLCCSHLGQHPSSRVPCQQLKMWFSVTLSL